MITLDDWSELATIDYYGGLGGEFFGSILYEAINKNFTYKSAKNNKFEFNQYDVFTNFKENLTIKKQGLKKYYYLKRKFYNLEVDAVEDKMLKDLYDEIFNEKTSFSEGFRNYVYKNYKDRFDGGIKISLFHTNNSDLVSKSNDNLTTIFPKSKNIIFTCPEHYMFLSKFLLVLKVLSNDVRLKNKEKFKKSIEDDYSKYYNFDFYYFDSYPAFKLDIFELIYEEKNYDKELSDLLGKEIILNKEKIKEYANQNINIFEKYGFDIYHVYSRDHFKEKLNIFITKLLNSDDNI